MSLHKQRRLQLAGALAGSALTITTIGLPTAANAAPRQTDLVVTASADPAEVVDSGDWSTLTVDIRNDGRQTSDPVTLSFALPAGVVFVGDGYVIPESWECDLFGTVTCTTVPIPAKSAAEPLSIPVRVAAGTAGDVLTLSATASGGNESSVANNTGTAALRYIPATVDLDFTAEPVEYQRLNGEVVGLNTYVENTGRAKSGEVAVTVPLPAGLVPYSASGDGWTCAYGDTAADGLPGYRCTYAPLWAGQRSNWLDVVAKVSGAQPGTVLDMVATVSNPVPDVNPDNDTLRTRVTVVEPVTIRGTVWVDSDQDGVRDEGEPGAATASIAGIQLEPQVDGQPGTTATVNPDGTYVAQARPGTYRVRFAVRNIYIYIDSADSDLVYYDNISNSSGTRYGYGDWIRLAGGEEAAVDAGVLSYF
ncbi:hypothetical protein KBX37_06145 [Micromonospora sp. U56]|uniref:SdrD B-like domain-containing protein n=1 Tax=Micromonospora sp. U56 TaxID=2824900 RepID=UPI001B3857E8|nr:SdrD B-like domain-containing protein [Micromonospora sp. U56]MBQ0892688.1 hypothetical protein [Micromonospora sp. U56]